MSCLYSSLTRSKLTAITRYWRSILLQPFPLGLTPWLSATWAESTRTPSTEDFTRATTSTMEKLGKFLKLKFIILHWNFYLCKLVVMSGVAASCKATILIKLWLAGGWFYPLSGSPSNRRPAWFWAKTSVLTAQSRHVVSWDNFSFLGWDGLPSLNL